MSAADEGREPPKRKAGKVKRSKPQKRVAQKVVLTPRNRGARESLPPLPAPKQDSRLHELSDKDLTVKRPISVKIERERGCYYLSNDTLNVYASGGSLPEAQQEFQKILKGLYMCFTDTPDEELTADAQALKKQLRAHLERH